jgi:hypothetical protein
MDELILCVVMAIMFIIIFGLPSLVIPKNLQPEPKTPAQSRSWSSRAWSARIKRSDE